jgi:Nif-specific regulatory protein
MVEEERRRLLDENTHLRQELRERYDFSNIIGTSGPTRQMYEQVAQVAQTNTTVLIRGESGTGKELIAHAIHYNSLRAKKPFVKVSCAALPDTLIESELFGYEKGAFTGATARKKGRFELAEGGTLFLDEIGDINPGTQVKLLRVLQEREFERLGGTETVKVNVRLIAATNKDMEKAIADGTFREDLYYRLNVFTIFVPPLRERKADLLLLADHFLEKFSREHGKVIKRISTPAIDMLMAYHWPGNVRELENALERAVLVCDGAGHPRAPPAAVAADGRGLGHRHARVAEGRRGRLRARSHPGRAEDHARQPRQGRAAARHDRADPQLQGARLRHRRAALQGSWRSGVWAAPHSSPSPSRRRTWTPRRPRTWGA